MNLKEKMSKKTGITLITLVVTIIILLILAGITIATITSNNGIIKNVNDAKEQTEIAEEKEIVDRATIQAMGNNKYGNIVEDELQSELDKETGEGKTEITDIGEEFEIAFIDTKRYYTVDKEGNVGEAQDIIEDKSPGDITKDENGNEIDEVQSYEIWCIEDLVEWSENYQNYQNSNVILGRTLNFKSNYSYSNGKMLGCNSIEELKALLTNTSGRGFTPINSFNGTFDGKNFEIKNIYENLLGNAGLFANAGGTIINLKISGNIISIDGDVGGIISRSMEGLYIGNCVNSCNIKSTSDLAIGGRGELFGSAGGIIGRGHNEIIIDKCSNLGEINAKYGGGILAYEYNANNIKVINCFNKGKINADTTGGIVGRTASGKIQIYNSYNIGDCSGKYVGGIIGYRTYNTTTEIKNVYNFSKVGGDTYQGDIIGYNWAYNTEVSPIIENVFYTNQTIGAFGGGANSIGTPVYFEDISDNNFVTKLNEYVSSVTEQYILWNSWILGKGGYPIFE